MGSGREEVDGKELLEIQEELKRFSSKAKDPMVLGYLFFKLSKEREAMNSYLQKVIERMEGLEREIISLEKRVEEKGIVGQEGIPLPEADEKIVSFLKRKSGAFAEQVQDTMGYKGKNAASARLNSLCRQGILEKAQVGKKVFFKVK
jgi:hypothetical protein